jgi:chromosome segregation ATPase
MMGIKEYFIGGLALALTALAINWYRGKIDQARLQGQLEEVLIDLEAARTARDSVEAELVPVIEQLTVERDSLSERQDTLAANLRIAHRSARVWRTRYDEVRNDSTSTVAEMMEAADSAVATLADEAQDCSLALRNCGTITANLEEENAAMNDRFKAVRDLSIEQGRTIEALQAVQPKTNLLPWAIAAVSLALTVLVVVF